MDLDATQLLAEAKKWKRPGGNPGSRAGYQPLHPTIDWLASKGWTATQIKDALIARGKWPKKQADALYAYIRRRLKPKADT